MKKSFLAVFLFFIFFLFFPNSILAKDYYFPKVEGQYQIQSDGSVGVLERRTYEFSGSFSWADIFIPLKISRKGYSYNAQIINFMVSENGKGVNLVENGPQGDKYYAKWTYSAFNQTRTFDISYTLYGAMGQGEDYTEFYWQVIGDQWDKRTQNAEFLVTFPNNIPRDQVYVFAHGPLNGKYDFVGNNQAKFTVSDIRPKQFVEVRLVFPKGNILAQQNSQNNLQKLLAEEKSILEKEQRNAVLRGVFLLLLFLVTGLWVVYWIWAWFKYGKEYKVEVPKYHHDPPSRLPPALVEILLNQNNNIGTQSFIATLFDLAKKKYLSVATRRYLVKILFFTQSKYEYAIVFKIERENLNNNPNLSTFEKMYLRELGDLHSHLTEEQLVGFGIKRDDHVVTFDDLKKHIKTAGFGSFWQSFRKAVKKEAEKRGFLEQGSVKKHNWFWISAAILGVLNFTALSLLSNAFFTGVLASFFSLFWFVVIFRIILGIRLLFSKKGRGFHLFYFMRRWSKTYGEEARKWQAFRNFLEDIGHFRDKLPHHLPIWEEYLVYGILFGQTDKILKLMPQYIGEQVPNWYVGDGYVGIGSFSDFSTSLNSLSTNISSSFKAGTGGSFSGGGGFGGGGGGGGGGGAG